MLQSLQFRFFLTPLLVFISYVHLLFIFIISSAKISYNQFLLRLFDVLQVFLSPQVKRCTIITYKHCTQELPHELWNDLRLRILGN